MDQNTILAKLTEIVRTLFDEYDGPVDGTLNAKMVTQWDSLANVQFMVLVEQAFKVRFTVSEITGLKNVGELMQVIQGKLGR
jgi:acyl carrier protein